MTKSVSLKPDLLDKLNWSDKACFKLSGHMNRDNWVYWTDYNPHVTIISQLNQSGITKWGTMYNEDLVEPVFFDGTLDGAN